jgi:exopolysaccharide production protein ExoZ
MREKVASIQFLRFVAASIVVLFHTTVALEKYFAGSLTHYFVSNAVIGASGVHIFFVISGFIMVYTSFRAATGHFDSAKFAFRRLIRIYPIYMICALFYLCVYFAFDAGKNLSVAQLFGSMFLLPGYSGLIIGPGWTLSYELYFYLCFGIAMTLGLVRGLLALTLFFIAAIAARFVFDTSNPFLHVFTSSLLIEFLLGAWIGYAAVSLVRIGNTIANMMLVASLAGFLAGVVFGFTRLPSSLTWGLPSALLVAGLVFRENNGSVPSLIQKFSFLGDSSYSLYLLHVVLIDIVIFLAIGLFEQTRVFISLVTPVGMMAACFLIVAYCIVAAFLSYEFVERRVLYLLQNLYTRKIAVAPK